MAYWKNIIGFPEYEVDTLGRVWSWNRLKFLKLRLFRGYNRLRLYNGGKGYNKLVHRLVLEAFRGQCPSGKVACHINGHKLDNRLENLKWDTQSNNIKDAVKQGTHSCLMCIGEKHGNSKLKEQDIRMIVYLYKVKLLTQQEIADIYHVTNSLISGIINKKSWKHIWSR